MEFADGSIFHGTDELNNFFIYRRRKYFRRFFKDAGDKYLELYRRLFIMTGNKSRTYTINEACYIE